MVTAARRRFRPARAALALLVAGAVVAGCGDDRPFSRNNTASDATKLAVPSTLTPPVQVERVDGAPHAWHMNEKVAEALRQRDIPAGTARQGSSAYVLRGTVRETGKTDKSAQVSVVWSLYDTKGKKVGEVTQVAAVPRAVMRKVNDDVLDAIADAAAESISPIVPSTRIDVADNVNTGEAEDKTRAPASKTRVTALGRQKKTNSGIARNFDALVKGKTTQDNKVDLPRPLHRGDDERKKTPVSAIGRLDDGKSALSRNLARGINPGAGDEKKGRRKPAADPADRTVDARPPDLADPRRRAPKVAFRERPKPAKTGRRDDAKQVAAAPAPKKAPPRPVLTEFYPTPKPKVRQRAETPPARTAKAKPPPRKPAAVAEIPKPAPKAAAKRTAPKKTAARRVAPKQVAKAAEPPRKHGKYVFWVQVGSYRTPELSAAKWTETRKQAPKLLGNIAHRIARARVGDRGIWHRIQVGPYRTKDAALRMCRDLKAEKVDCFILPERAGPDVTPVSEAPRRRLTVVTNDTGRPRSRPDPAAKPAPAAKAPAFRRGARAAATRKHYPLTTSPGLPGLIPSRRRAREGAPEPDKGD